ncbi:hypothetical protein ADUPG1_005321, partial [Aduncisulcus paluster]
MKSTAPASKPLDVLASSSRALRKRIGISDVSWDRRSTVAHSNPFSPGIMMSSSI